MAGSIRSLDVVWDQVCVEREAQGTHLDALDTKAGIVLGFAGAVVALASTGVLVLVNLGRSAAVASGAFAVWTVWPRHIWTTDLRVLRDHYLGAEPDFSRLRLLDTHIEMAESLATVLTWKAKRLKWAMALLLAATMLTAAGFGIH